MQFVTREQVVALKARLWPAACAARGWDKNDRDWQMQVLSEIIGRRIESSTQIEKLKEFTAVKVQLEAWSHSTDLKRAVRTLNNPRRVLTHRIQIEQVRLLSVLLGEPRVVLREHPHAEDMEPNLEGALNYVAALMARRFRTEDITQISAVPQLRNPGTAYEVEKSDLELLRDTLDRCISELRQKKVQASCKPSMESGWSEHDLKTAAGIECHCATYCRKPSKAAEATAAKILADARQEVGS